MWSLRQPNSAGFLRIDEGRAGLRIHGRWIRSLCLSAAHLSGFWVFRYKGWRIGRLAPFHLPRQYAEESATGNGYACKKSVQSFAMPGKEIMENIAAGLGAFVWMNRAFFERKDAMGRLVTGFFTAVMMGFVWISSAGAYADFMKILNAKESYGIVGYAVRHMNNLEETGSMTCRNTPQNAAWLRAMLKDPDNPDLERSIQANLSSAAFFEGLQEMLVRVTGAQYRYHQDKKAVQLPGYSLRGRTMEGKPFVDEPYDTQPLITRVRRGGLYYEFSMDPRGLKEESLYFPVHYLGRTDFTKHWSPPAGTDRRALVYSIAVEFWATGSGGEGRSLGQHWFFVVTPPPQEFQGKTEAQAVQSVLEKARVLILLIP